MTEGLVVLYDRMSRLTEPICSRQQAECSRFAGRQNRCCERRYCEITAEFAKSKYNIILHETGNPEIPFMGPHGCTVPPHLRPICSLHLCSIAWGQQSTVMNDPEKTKEYFNLRTDIINTAREEGKDPL